MHARETMGQRQETPWEKKPLETIKVIVSEFNDHVMKNHKNVYFVEK